MSDTNRFFVVVVAAFTNNVDNSSEPEVHNVRVNDPIWNGLHFCTSYRIADEQSAFCILWAQCFSCSQTALIYEY